jgi:pimeloyl-ACP methyl ester carboxylesterase
MSDQNKIEQKRAPGRQRGGCMVPLAGLLVGLLLLLLAGAAYESLSEAADARLYPPPGQMVDVSGFRLHINCMGEGSPTVVIEAGLGDSSASWGLVQREVAKTTRVCSYDRAGMGWSEPGPLPRDARQFARELHALLQKANVRGPHILVGHSLGGLPVSVFVHDYPSEVAGVVLIDSMFPGQTGYATQTQALSLLSVLARFGFVRLLAKPLGLANPAPPDAAAASYSRSVRPQSLQTFADEIQGIPDSLREAGAVESFGDLPLIVLSRGLDADAAWQAGQDELSRLSSNSQHLTAEHSDHTIQVHQPDAAVAAILKMIEQVRK